MATTPYFNAASVSTEHTSESVAIHILLVCFLMTLKAMYVGFTSAFLCMRAFLFRIHREKNRREPNTK